MEDVNLIVDFALAVGLAFVGGSVAQRLGQPVILGYLLAGFALGPFTPGPIADQHSIEILAEIGVAFLMFALGAEISIAELRQLGRVSLIGGPLQIVTTMLLGIALAPILQLTVAQGAFFGALLALSSTVVVLKILMARGELQDEHGRLALGILIAQDLAVVPMVIILPALAGQMEALPLALGAAALKVLLVLVVVYILGARLVPWILTHAALSRTRELFLLSVVTLALGTAVATHAAGLSIAFGAFLAGLVVAESDYRAQVVAEVLPFRDLFAALFFVSIGMLLNPVALLGNAGIILVVTAAVLIGKAVIGTLIVVALGASGRAALLTGLSIAQVGEFSFVLARIGVSEAVIPGSLFDLTLATALLSIVATPWLLRLGPRLEAAVQRLPLLGSRFVIKMDIGQPVLEAEHIVICGYGRVGKELGDELDRRGQPYVVVEYNSAVVTQLRAQGRPVLYGDASNPVILEHAGVPSARMLAVLIPDGPAAELVTRHARAMSAALDIVVRAVRADDVPSLRRAGADEVVQPEFEAGMEVIRHVLGRAGVDVKSLEGQLALRREAFYRSPLSEHADPATTA